MPRALTALCLSLALSAVPRAVLGADKEKFEVGEEVPNFLLRTLNGDKSGMKVFSLDNFVGPEASEKKKAVLVSFFATYCEPCKREMPFLQALYKEFRAKGLLVASVSIDKDDPEIKKVNDLAAQNNLEYPLLSDRYNIVAKRYFVQKLPCLYIVDERGKVAKVSIGYDDSASADILAEVRKNLGLAVADPVPASLTAFVKSPDNKPAVETLAAKGAVNADIDAADPANAKKLKAKRAKRAKAADAAAAGAKPAATKKKFGR